MATLGQHLNEIVKLAIVQKSIVCPRSGDVLDIKTAVFAYDADGDPVAAISPAGLASVTDAERADWRAAGIYLTPNDQEV